MHRTLSSTCLAVILLLAPVTGVKAFDDIIRSDCLPFVKKQSQLNYDDTTHAKWYQNYWDGRCKGLFICFRRTGWNQHITNIVAQASAADKAAVLKMACRVGAEVGFEWARDNDIRCIHSKDNGGHNLKVLGKILGNQQQQPAQRLTAVKAKIATWCTTPALRQRLKQPLK